MTDSTQQQEGDMGQVARDADENSMAKGGLVALRYEYLTDREQEAWRAAALAVQVATQEAGRDQPEKEQKQQETDAWGLYAQADFAARWWHAHRADAAPLTLALELARETAADLDAMVACGLLIAEGGLVRLAVSRGPESRVHGEPPDESSLPCPTEAGK